MSDYNKTLKAYEDKGEIPLAKLMPQPMRIFDRPVSCPYCNLVFAVSISDEHDHFIHCPDCCMELEYERQR